MSIDADTVADAATAPTPAGLNYRYPGSAPFQDTELDRRLFRGRAEEADTVLHSILSSDLFLLYAVSGMGKTSLLNASVMHRLRARGHWPVSVRLNDPRKPPVVEIREQIEDAADADQEIELLWLPGDDVANRPDASLWDLLASLEVWRGNDLQRLVVIFDQFEELFTLGWADAAREEFISQLGEVVRGHRRHASAAPNGLGTPPPAVKFILVIREDSLGELEALATEVPQVMRNRFRLVALDPVQAAAAIREPARVADGRLDSQPFSYTEAATQEILEFLRTTTERGQAVQSNQVDPPQLQIVCQYVERAILPNKPAPAPGDVIEIDAADLGGRSGLERILGDFYRRTLQTFPASRQKAVRHLCERGLINPAGRRLSLEEGEINDGFGVPPELLHQLVDERLVRADPRVGSVYYELAHDTLVPPIRAFAEEDRARRRRRRRRWIASAAAVLAVAVVSSFAFTLGSDTDEDGNSAQRLSVGQSATGSVAAPGADVLFAVQPDDDQILLVGVRPVGPEGASTNSTDQDGAAAALNVALELTAGGVQRQQDQLGAGQGEQMVVPPGSESSRQEVAVTSFDSTTGPFEITVEEAAVSDLGPGSTAFGTIAAAGDLAVFRVAIAGGTPVVVDITPTLAAGADGPSSEGEKPRLDVQVELLDPRGIRTAVDTDGAGQPERVQVSGVDGQYLVIVRGYTTTTGQFDIAANRVRRALASGQRTTGEIDGTDVAEFTYELTPGGSYAALAIQPGPDFDPILEIAGPGGGSQTMDNGGAGSVEVGVMGPTEGPYLVTVTGYESSTGRFSLEVVALDQTLTEGRAETGHIVGAAVAPFVFETPGASPVVVALDAGPGLDPVLEIVGPTGQIFTVDNDATRSEFALLGGPPATYVLAVRWYQPSTGDFELAADATVPSPLEPGDSVSASGPMVFDVETPAGDGLELTATAASANTDVGIHVNDASGFPIDRLSSEGEPVSVTLAGESSYQVLVWSSGPAGDYTVTLSSAGVAAE